MKQQEIRPDWTSECIAEMHTYGITARKLAQYLDWTPEYLSMVLRGVRAPKTAEQKVRAALDLAVSERICDF